MKLGRRQRMSQKKKKKNYGMRMSKEKKAIKILPFLCQSIKKTMKEMNERMKAKKRKKLSVCFHLRGRTPHLMYTRVNAEPNLLNDNTS